MRWMVKIYDKTIAWSQHPHAVGYLAAISFADASFFPIPPFFMFAPMAVAKPNKAWHYALVATIASVLGGMLGYCLGYLIFNPVVLPLIQYFGYETSYQNILQAFHSYGLIALLILGATPMPYKLISIGAGFLMLPFHTFVMISLLSRGLKFFVLALLVKIGGENIENRLRTVVEKLGFVCLGLCGLALYVYLR
jgi:membrane protein YqaA with SNARE-associated domain